MAKTARRAMFWAALALAAAAPAFARAENAPPAAASADPNYESQKTAFEALPQADRRAIQDALIWSGHYLGIIDGVFGKRTRDAILAYQASAKAPADGTIDAAQLAAMAAAAQKARAAVRFQVFTDEKTGVKIGAPLKILDKRVPNDAGGVRLAKTDGSVALELFNIAGGEAKLGVIFAALTAEADGRKITLKLSRPDFFVVSGEDDGRKFYQRMAKAPADSPDAGKVRGFKFTYPAAQSAELDRIGVAIADAFEPFPAAAPAPAGTIAAAPTPTPAPAPAPTRPAFAATGLLVAPGQALSAIGAADCPNPTIDGKPAKFMRDDRELGLSLLGLEAAGGASVGALSFGTLGPDLVALSYSADESGGRVVLNVAAASPLTTARSQAHPSVLASLPRQAGGALVFDRMGGLVAIVAQGAGDQKLVAGVAPFAPHVTIPGDAIQRFLALPPDAAAKAASAQPLGAGQIAAAERPFVVAISCRR
jgi:hypothetical protein